jgi:glycosyltransferase involved in cell wall biosynthesis
VATLGYVDPRKRHRDVLEALARLPQARWLVIGDGPERPTLAARAEELGLADRVEWAGALAPREAMHELARCHAMAMPSVDEAFGVSYVEALACGLPAIGCAGEPGPEELARLTRAMVLVPPRDPEALAGALAELLPEPPRSSEPAGDAAGAPLASEAAATGARLLAECGPLTVAAYRDALA